MSRQLEGQKVPEKAEEVRNMVREGYGEIARGGGSCCGETVSCCGTSSESAYAEAIGYQRKDLEAVPEGSNLGLGCGNPTAIAELKEGDVVLDLGSGAGFDAFLAAREVGETGRVIGVDMTPDMLARARRNAVQAGLESTVEFREGEIENLPVIDNSVDVIISNCVINLSPDKASTFREAFRVLKKGGRLAISDIVLSEPLEPEIIEMAEGYISCISGASLAEDYLGLMREAGFTDITWERTSAAPLFSMAGDPILKEAIDTLGEERVKAAAQKVWSYKIRGVKA